METLSSPTSVFASCPPRQKHKTQGADASSKTQKHKTQASRCRSKTQKHKTHAKKLLVSCLSPLPKVSPQTIVQQNFAFPHICALCMEPKATCTRLTLLCEEVARSLLVVVLVLVLRQL